MNILIEKYRYYLGNAENKHYEIASKLSKIILENITYPVGGIKVFNLNNENHDFNSGKEDMFVIFIGGTAKPEPYRKDLTIREINGLKNKYNIILLPDGTDSIIYSEENMPIAQWNNETNELNILINLFNSRYLEDFADIDSIELTNNAIKIFEYIIQKWNDDILPNIVNKNSWMHKENIEKLKSRIKVEYKNVIDEEVDILKSNTTQRKQIIDRLRKDLTRNISVLQSDMIKLDLMQNKKYEFESKIFKELDLISEHELIEDIQIIDNLFVFHTKPLYIYDSNNTQYYGGNFKIVIKPKTSDIHLSSNMQRPSYWSDKDYHPHIDGNCGRACFGNVEPTIAELSSQLELYALVTVILEFLQSANLDDCAGKNVVNWDKVDKEGNIIKTDHTYCDNCGNVIGVNRDKNVAYSRIDEENDVLEDEHIVCTRCLESYYYFDEDYEQYVHVI